MKFANFPKLALLPLAGILTLILAGCGSTVSNLGLTEGNWAFTATSTGSSIAKTGPTFVIGGDLTQSGTNLTGSMYITQSGCIVPQFVTFTGTVKDKNITLTSESFGGQVIAVSATGTKDSLTGTYTVTGECSDSGTITASAVPSISGTWSGTISNPQLGIAVATLSVALSQSATPSEDGTFPLTGTLTYTNSACAVSGTITNGYLAGNFISFNALTDGETGSVSFDQVTLNSVTAPTTMTGGYSFASESCNQEQSLTLTKQ